MTAAVRHGTAPLGLVKKTEVEFDEWIATEQGFMTTFGSYDDDPLKLEAYQMGFLMNRAGFRSVEKSRQTGYSFVFAIESLARSHLRPTHTSVFVSYNLVDAKEKITYCKQLHEELPLEYQKKQVIDSKLELGFRSNSSGGRISRIISNPSRAPRGKHGDIYLDELAHCANDREIYKGSTALILRSGGQLTVCSSPLGRRGVFWEIAREETRAYKAYNRQSVPWWICRAFCRDTKTAGRLAGELETQVRVERFGTNKIIEQFESLPIEDFQQEFEVLYCDETLTFFPYELILRNATIDPADLATDFAELNNCAGRLVCGFDVGRKKDLSELVVFEQVDDRYKCRLIRSYKQARFVTQEADLRALLTLAPVARLSIDQSSIGMQLAENLAAEFPGVVVPETFSNERKELWCTDFKIGLQRDRITLPRDRDLIAQIHSIRKEVTPSGRVTFDAARDSSGHADRFWACALACRKERGGTRLGEVSVRIVG